MLKVEGLNAGYGSVNILWDIGFEVKDGEIVAILGSNGAGKTTMVRTITGMVKASSGKVEFNGEDLSGKSSRVILDSGIVQVPEGRQLFTEMTVLENLELGAFNKETKAHFAENLEKCYNWFPKLRERAKQVLLKWIADDAFNGGWSPCHWWLDCYLTGSQYHVQWPTAVEWPSH